MTVVKKTSLFADVETFYGFFRVTPKGHWKGHGWTCKNTLYFRLTEIAF